MKKEELIKLLKKIAEEQEDPMKEHQQADKLLLDYINDPKVTTAFEDIEKWYA